MYRRRLLQEDENFNQTYYNLRNPKIRTIQDKRVDQILEGSSNDSEIAEKSLRFESRFEGGNLAMVSMVK